MLKALERPSVHLECLCGVVTEETYYTGHRDKKRVTNQGLGILCEKKSKYKAYQLKKSL